MKTDASNTAIYFNPRSPRGERPRRHTTMSRRELISIHAPREGSDSCRTFPHSASRDFNPRSPRGERRNFKSKSVSLTDFNPRSPRGERLCPFGTGQAAFHYFNPRSPRGERLRGNKHTDYWAAFQSTLPARGATQTAEFITKYFDISIHAPREGSDLSADNPLCIAWISIHAPREGSDEWDDYMAKAAEDFNPRSPRGERLLHPLSLLGRMSYFNPRSPRGERHRHAPLDP